MAKKTLIDRAGEALTRKEVKTAMDDVYNPKPEPASRTERFKEIMSQRNIYETEAHLGARKMYHGTKGQVVSVDDGDTLSVKTQYGNVIQVRALDIDTPEIYHKGHTKGSVQQPGGMFAKIHAENKFLGKEVTLNIPGQKGNVKDAFGRYMADVQLTDGETLSTEMGDRKNWDPNLNTTTGAKLKAATKSAAGQVGRVVSYGNQLIGHMLHTISDETRMINKTNPLGRPARAGVNKLGDFFQQRGEHGAYRSRELIQDQAGKSTTFEPTSGPWLKRVQANLYDAAVHPSNIFASVIESAPATGSALLAGAFGGPAASFAAMTAFEGTGDLDELLQQDIPMEQALVIAGLTGSGKAALELVPLSLELKMLQKAGGKAMTARASNLLMGAMLSGGFSEGGAQMIDNTRHILTMPDKFFDWPTVIEGTAQSTVVGSLSEIISSGGMATTAYAARPAIKPFLEKPAPPDTTVVVDPQTGLPTLTKTAGEGTILSKSLWRQSQRDLLTRARKVVEDSKLDQKSKTALNELYDRAEADIDGGYADRQTGTPIVGKQDFADPVQQVVYNAALQTKSSIQAALVLPAVIDSLGTNLTEERFNAAVEAYKAALKERGIAIEGLVQRHEFLGPLLSAENAAEASAVDAIVRNYEEDMAGSRDARAADEAQGNADPTSDEAIAMEDSQEDGKIRTEFDSKIPETKAIDTEGAPGPGKEGFRTEEPAKTSKARPATLAKQQAALDKKKANLEKETKKAKGSISRQLADTAAEQRFLRAEMEIDMETKTATIEDVEYNIVKRKGEWKVVKKSAVDKSETTQPVNAQNAEISRQVMELLGYDVIPETIGTDVYDLEQEKLDNEDQVSSEEHVRKRFSDTGSRQLGKETGQVQINEYQNRATVAGTVYVIDVSPATGEVKIVRTLTNEEAQIERDAGYTGQHWEEQRAVDGTLKRLNREITQKDPGRYQDQLKEEKAKEAHLQQKDDLESWWSNKEWANRMLEYEEATQEELYEGERNEPTAEEYAVLADLEAMFRQSAPGLKMTQRQAKWAARALRNKVNKMGGNITMKNFGLGSKMHSQLGKDRFNIDQMLKDTAGYVRWKDAMNQWADWALKQGVGFEKVGDKVLDNPNEDVARAIIEELLAARQSIKPILAKDKVHSNVGIRTKQSKDKNGPIGDYYVIDKKHKHAPQLEAVVKALNKFWRKKAQMKGEHIVQPQTVEQKARTKKVKAQKKKGLFKNPKFDEAAAQIELTEKQRKADREAGVVAESASRVREEQKKANLLFAKQEQQKNKTTPQKREIIRQPFKPDPQLVDPTVETTGIDPKTGKARVRIVDKVTGEITTTEFGGPAYEARLERLADDPFAQTAQTKWNNIGKQQMREQAKYNAEIQKTLKKLGESLNKSAWMTAGDALLNEYFGEQRKLQAQALFDNKQIVLDLAKTFGQKLYDPTSDAEFMPGVTVAQAAQAITHAIDLQRHPGYKEFLTTLSGEQRTLYKIAEDILASKSGKLAELKKIANTIDKQAAKDGRYGKKQGIFEEDMQEDHHITHLWDFDKKPMGNRPQFNQDPTQVHKRVFEKGGIAEGLAQGYVLKETDPAKLAKITRDNIAMAISSRKMINWGIEQGIMKSGLTAPAGMILLEHGGFYDHKGKKEHRLYAEPKLAKHLNNAYRKSALEGKWGVDLLTFYNAHLKRNLLLFSTFHFGSFIWSALMGTPGFSLMAPAKAYKIGKQAQLAQAGELMEGMYQGLTSFTELDYESEHTARRTALGAVLHNSTYTGKAWDTTQRIIKRYEKALFGMGDKMKAGSYLMNMEYYKRAWADKIQSGEITLDQIRHEVAKRVNADFGGKDYQRLGVNPTAMHVAKVGFLGYDWTLSNVETVYRAVLGKTKSETEIFRGLWSNVALHWAGMWLLGNMFAAHMDPEDDFMTNLHDAWSAGNLKWLDVNVTPAYKLFGAYDGKDKYLNVLRQFKDPIKWATQAPWVSMYHKMGVAAKTTTNFAKGTNWRGQHYTPLDQMWKEKRLAKKDFKRKGKLGVPFQSMTSFLLSEMRGTVPIPARAMWNAMGGAEAAMDSTMELAGFGVATDFTGTY
jgi:endonuclease YncB( thermonuclease family)